MLFLPEAFDLPGLLLAIMKRTQLRKRASIFEFKIGCACLKLMQTSFRVVISWIGEDIREKIEG